jgi:hypothetical protein
VAIGTLERGRDAGNRLNACPHFLLQPRWEAMENMGLAEKASEYVCESCGQAFAPTSKKTAKKHPFRWAIEVLFSAPSTVREEGPHWRDDSLRVLRIDRALLKQNHPRVHFVSRSISGDSPQGESNAALDDRAGVCFKPTDFEWPYCLVPPLN